MNFNCTKSMIWQGLDQNSLKLSFAIKKNIKKGLSTTYLC